MRYGDIRDNDLFWNKKQIGFGQNWFDAEVSGNYFKEIAPCYMKFPNAGGRTAKYDRQKMAALYTHHHKDKAVFATTIFMKIKPSDYGMGDYKQKIWFRFIVASDDTIIWAEPFPYSPTLFCGYDVDEERADNPSMALEIIPFQDHIGNILSQIILSIKQNLANAVFYDSNIVTEDVLKTISSKNAARHQLRPLRFTQEFSRRA